MAGAGYKLFNTGDVLTAAQVNTYLMEQTVMVFADAAARTTALTGVVSEGMISYLKDTNAVEVYNGSAWVSSDDPNAIQNTIVDAKGDLITATASDVPARLAVGNNGETLVADSSATTGLRWQEPKAGNPVINSAFQVWQRGTSFSAGAGAAYNADRWYHDGATGRTISRQNTGDTTNLPNIQYCLRIQRDSGSTATTNSIVSQSFETVNSIPFVGKTVTLSFYARRGANFSSTSNSLSFYLVSGTGTDQNQRSGYTNQALPINTAATLTTTWQRFQAVGTVASTATELAVVFECVPTGTAGAADYFEVTGVQLEVGSVATPFKTQGVTLAGELLAAQRYYYRQNAPDAYSNFGTGFAVNTTASRITISLPVTMRTKISTTVDSANLALYDGLSITGLTSLTVAENNTQTPSLNAGVAAGLTANRPYSLIANNSTSAYVGVSAEL